MKLTSEEALNMLENARGKTASDGWIDHSICVGNTAGTIAMQLGLDIEKAKTLGYIHDIGKSVGEFSNHVLNGYKYMKNLGYDDEYANICLTHSYLNNDYMCVAGGIPDDVPFRTEFIKTHQYTMYEKIINLCDLMCLKNPITLEKRLIDLIVRYGVHENTVYHIKEAQKLKKYFDDILGYNVYELFPNIVEN